MAEINSTSAIDEIRGKFQKKDRGYFYIRNGKQFYRNREETYQKNQSPKQKYNSEVFAYANDYMTKHYGTPEGKAQLRAECEAANHIGSNGKTYSTAWSWKFNSLQFEYRQAHPYKS
ncbi:MAG: hypothetical protein II140_02950 [Paludibacteraceae bacterium]|nr:hypothetical protein [Paludibacteraceae bacterium]MBQ2519982.1 hypothetical protein [Paludibacteraceae bacterium]